MINFILYTLSHKDHLYLTIRVVFVEGGLYWGGRHVMHNSSMISQLQYSHLCSCPYAMSWQGMLICLSTWACHMFIGLIWFRYMLSLVLIQGWSLHRVVVEKLYCARENSGISNIYLYFWFFQNWFIILAWDKHNVGKLQ